MKKFLFLVLTVSLLTTAQQSEAQVSLSEKLTIGVKAGINGAWYHYIKDELKYRKEDGDKSMLQPSFQLGILGDYEISENFSLQSGLIINGKGSRELWNDDWDDETGKSKENTWYVELPVYGVLQMDKLYFGAGPYIGIGLFGNWSTEYTDSNTGEVLENYSGKSFEFEEDKRIDFGINIMGGYKLNDNWHIGLNFGYGLTELWDDANNGNTVLSLSVSFWFK